jgi:hypothetical protein
VDSPGKLKHASRSPDVDAPQRFEVSVELELSCSMDDMRNFADQVVIAVIR